MKTHNTTSMLAFLLAAIFAGCEGKQDQLPPAARTDTGTQKAQDYPSTRNSEKSDPSIGGTNSAVGQQHAQPNPSGTGGSGDQMGK